MTIPLTYCLRRLLPTAALLALPFLSPAQAARPPAVGWALTQLAADRPRLGLTEQDLADPLVTNAYTDAHNGVSHVYLRQRHQGLEVVGSEMGLHFTRQGQPLHQTGSFVPRLAAAVRSTVPVLTPVAATTAAARRLGLTPRHLREVAARPGPAADPNRHTLLDEALSKAPIPVQLVLLRQDDNSVRLAWELELTPPTGPARNWHTQIDAVTGAVLGQEDRIVHEQPDGGGTAVAPTPAASVDVTATATAAATAARRDVAADGAVYNVHAFPLEAPSFGPRTVVTNPADPLASPFGWHDTNGVAGAEFTITRGNNVYAFAGTKDAPVHSPNGGAGLRFDFPYDITRPPLENRDAAVTTLFYLNNVVHDVTHYYGFNEVSGNFQTTNYTGLGLPDDAVFAASAAPEGINNADFLTPPDGQAPSMRMYLYPRPARLRFEVTAPAALAGTYAAVEGLVSFPATPLTGRLVVVSDGSAAPTLGCASTGLTNGAELSGNIAVIDRGSCTFSVKILAAQAAGAVAVVMINNVDGASIAMGGATVGILIPSLMISLADGNRLKAALAAGNAVTVAVQRQPALDADRDGSFDNGIVVHEYGHGISNRLTGGAARVDCLPRDNRREPTDPAFLPYETMGEGWSDFFGLWFTTRPGDVGPTPRGIVTYPGAQPTTGAGIRRKPYTTNFALNDLTYDIVGKPGYTGTHDVGTVWATVLWDLNWAMVARYGYSPDLYRGTAGNNKTMQLVMDGLKLQPCRPGFMTGRDAILAADRITYAGANQALIWNVFARRGMGSDAEQGTISALDGKAGFAVPAGMALAARPALAASAVELYPNPAQDAVLVRAAGSGLGLSGEVELSLTTLLGQTLYTTRVPAAQLRQGAPLDLRRFANGLYLVRLRSAAGSITKKVVVQH